MLVLAAVAASVSVISLVDQGSHSVSDTLYGSLVYLIGIWAVIWSLTKPGGYARVLIIGNWVQAIFRETMNYRHVWLLLAFLIVLDQRRTMEEEAGEAALDLPPEAGTGLDRPPGSSPSPAAAH